MSSDEPELLGHAFISYVREDSRVADRLERVLEAAGIPVWRDTSSLWPGQDWRHRIRHAITGEAMVFIACFSSRSVNRSKTYQNEELTLAIAELRQRPPESSWLIPVRFDACEIPDWDIGAGLTLASIQRVDLFGDLEMEGAARLVGVVLRALLRPRAWPSVPERAETGSLIRDGDPRSRSPGEVEDDDILLLKTPGEAKAIRRDTARFSQLPNTSTAAAELEAMGAKRAAMRLNLMKESISARIMDEMHSGPAAATLRETEKGRAAQILHYMDRSKAAAVLERMGSEEAAAMLLSLPPFDAQHIMARFADDKLAETISVMEPSAYAGIRAAEHPRGAFDPARARLLRSGKLGACLSAFVVTSTAAVLYWAVVFPRLLTGWGWLLWLIGSITLPLCIWIGSTKTQKQGHLVICATGFWLATVSLVLMVTHFLPAFFALSAAIATTASFAAISSGEFLSTREQDRRQTRTLPDSPASVDQWAGGDQREVDADGVHRPAPPSAK